MKKYLLGTLALAALFAIAAPASSYAALFAYVNQDGEIRTVEAADPNTAIMTAPSIHMNSGVLLLNSSSDPIIGDDVSGV